MAAFRVLDPFQTFFNLLSTAPAAGGRVAVDIPAPPTPDIVLTGDGAAGTFRAGTSAVAKKFYVAWGSNTMPASGQIQAAGSFTFPGGVSFDEAPRVFVIPTTSSNGTLAGLPPFNPGGGLPANANVLGSQSVETTGALSAGIVLVNLVNDVDLPAPTTYYGADGTGEKGWFPIADAFAAQPEITLTVGADGVTTISITAIPDSGAGTLLAITRNPPSANASCRSGAVASVLAFSAAATACLSPANLPSALTRASLLARSRSPQAPPLPRSSRSRRAMPGSRASSASVRWTPGTDEGCGAASAAGLVDSVRRI